jgi:hypothetical protein
MERLTRHVNPSHADPENRYQPDPEAKALGVVRWQTHIGQTIDEQTIWRAGAPNNLYHIVRDNGTTLAEIEGDWLCALSAAIVAGVCPFADRLSVEWRFIGFREPCQPPEPAPDPIGDHRATETTTRRRTRQ